MIKVTVTRAFCLAGLRQEVGTVVEVTPALAAELVALAKASYEVFNEQEEAEETEEAEKPKRKAKKENHESV